MNGLNERASNKRVRERERKANDTSCYTKVKRLVVPYLVVFIVVVGIYLFIYIR